MLSESVVFVLCESVRFSFYIFRHQDRDLKIFEFVKKMSASRLVHGLCLALEGHY